MEDDLKLTTSQQLKAFAHPIRQKMLLRLHDIAMTNAELADALGFKPGHLHFHTRQLLSAGLIEIVGTRVKGPITEKLYRTAAGRYTMEALPVGAGLPLEPTFQIGLELYRKNSDVAMDGPSTASCLAIPMSRELAQSYLERVEELQRDLIAHSQTSAVDQIELYVFTTVMHRMLRDAPNPKTEMKGDNDDLE